MDSDEDMRPGKKPGEICLRELRFPDNEEVGNFVYL